MLYLTGDMHAALETEPKYKCKQYPNRLSFMNSLKEDDILIVLGDFGYTWTPNKLAKYSCPAITLLVDGNHENFTYLDSCPQILMFGDTVGVVKERVYRLLTGHIYNIEGLTAFIFGGALSVDKAWRTPYTSWWPEEIPSSETFRLAGESLDKVQGKIDLFLAHTCSEETCDKFFNYSYHVTDPVERMLSQLEYHIKDLNPDAKYYFLFGHHHTCRIDGRYICLYDSIVQLHNDAKGKPILDIAFA